MDTNFSRRVFLWMFPLVKVLSKIFPSRFNLHSIGTRLRWIPDGNYFFMRSGGTEYDSFIYVRAGSHLFRGQMVYWKDREAFVVTADSNGKTLNDLAGMVV